MSFGDHLMIAPIVIPLLAGSLMLALDGRKWLSTAINVLATLALLAVSVALLVTTNLSDPAAVSKAYLLGNWPANFGIILIVDRLAARSKGVW